ncbi:MAG: VCBS repeat-containing protein [Kofleriaceae bacterium]|nr:VCBS repeat-containing protein [Kofleriaceae bacterium]
MGALLTTLGAGCGDGKICQSEILVIIRSPSGVILDDSNVDMAGVQTDVSIRSTAGEGAVITLQVLDDSGVELSTVDGETDADGNITFTDVDLPAGAAALRASVDAGECGSDEDEVALTVAAGSGCEVALRETPLANDFYAPLGVLNQSNDSDGATPDFQAHVEITTSPGADVEVFLIGGDSGQETSAGVVTADGDGAAELAVTLGQGRQGLRAVCTAAGGVLTSPSLTTTVFVDTEEPTCALTSPAPGASVTPGLDANGDLSDGVQLTLGGNAGGGDTTGEAAQFVVTVDGTPTTLAGTDVDAGGDSAVDATIDPASTPSTATIAFATRDHAGNACAVDATYDVVYDGCDISVVSPTGVVTADADGDAGNGVQVDFGLVVDTACAGQTVTSDCGLDNPSATVAVDGTVTVRANWCGEASCDVTDTCTFTVSNPAGIETSAAQTTRFDNLAPIVSLQVSQPAVACGAEVAPSADVAPGTPGTQVKIRVVAPVALTRSLAQTSSSGTQSYDASISGGEVTVTLDDGVNSFVGSATDDNGNTGVSPTCTLTLTDVVVGISPPADDGTVGAADGTVAGSSLTFDLCGTVSETGATVDVTVDGGAPIAATVVGTGWCVNLTLAESPPSYAIVATATIGLRTGSTSLALNVDLAPPSPIGDLAVIADTRQSLRATWSAPTDGGAPAFAYRVKVATVALTDANFDTTGVDVPSGVPGAPGAAEVLSVDAMRTGTPVWFGIAPVDSSGNRAAAAIVGPLTPLFDQSAAMLPPDTTGDVLAGTSIAHGRFNDDNYDDVAVGAPGVQVAGLAAAGAVYVYFGSATGLSATPDVIITGNIQFGNLGFAVTAVRWSSGSRDDLVIGEPFGDNANGRVYVFDGGAGFGTGTIPSSAADLVIGASATSAYFAGGGLGFSLTTLDYDGDGTDDLAMGDVAGGAGNGGVVILFGGTIGGSPVLLNEASAAEMNGAVGWLINDPLPAAYDIFGNYVWNAGPTLGATDQTDDLLITYADGVKSVFLYRGTGSRPAAPGLAARAFTVGQDVRIDYASTDATLEYGSAAGSIADVNGDGARDLVIAAPRDGANAGRVLIVDGNTVGTAGVASTATAGVLIASIGPAAGVSLFGTAVVNNGRLLGADVDGDGQEDLLVTGKSGGIQQMYVWFGGSIPTGTVTTATAGHVISGPSEFNGNLPSNGASNVTAIWAGDVNADGLADVCWGDATGNGLDGSVQILWDDGN